MIILKIGIFGGSFNPPHLGHQLITRELIEKGYVDKMIVVPTGDEYEKLGLIDAYHRYQMSKLTLETIPTVEVSNYEVRNGKKYAYETLEHFKRKYPENSLYLVVGADNLNELTT